MRDQLKAVAVGLISLAAILTAVWAFIDAVVGSINRLQSTVAGSIVAASIAAIAAFLVNVYVKHRESREKVLQEIRARKTPVYEELIDIIFSGILSKQQGKGEVSPEELTKRFAAITPKIVIWGSEELIAQWNVIRSHDWKAGGSPLETFAPWNQFMLTVRKDLGHSNKKLKPFALMRLFVNDFPKS
jgi:hypothetical protein